MTGEGNGRATVTYEDEETADKAISEYNGKLGIVYMTNFGIFLIWFRSTY